MVRLLFTTDPFDYRSTSLAHINGDGGGIPQTVGLAVSSNNESKPIWLCVQAFESGNWLMPSVREMRGQLYTGIVSGSTGIIYFASELQRQNQNLPTNPCNTVARVTSLPVMIYCSGLLCHQSR